MHYNFLHLEIDFQWWFVNRTIPKNTHIFGDGSTKRTTPENDFQDRFICYGAGDFPCAQEKAAALKKLVFVVVYIVQHSYQY
jgi:hypothetical protein